MQNLFFRNRFVFGVLMVCVMALGVQGIADALTFTDPPNGGNLGVVGMNQGFSLTFRTNAKNPTNILNSSRHRVSQETDNPRIDNSGYKLTTIDGTTTTYRESTDADKTGFRNAITGETGRQEETGAHVDSSGNVVDAEGRSLYEALTGSTRLKADPDPPVSVANRFHHNEEAIAISSGDSISLTKNRITIPVLSTAPARLSETPSDITASLWDGHEDSNRRPSGSITLTGVATEAGVYTITITDVTPLLDIPLSGSRPRTTSDTLTQDFITFTITVLQAANDARAGTLSGLSDKIVGEFGTTPLMATVADVTSTTNIRVEFEITKGAGSLSAEQTIGSKTSKRLSTLTDGSGIATVSLDPRKGTNHVRAWIYGNDPGTAGKTTEGIYIYRWASLKKVSGDSVDPQQNQKGPVSSRLEEPFVVQLFDSTGRTTIPGAEITFTATASPPGSLRYDPSTPSNLRGAVLASDAVTATVTTDSNGKASIFLVLGDTAGNDYTVTAAYRTFDTETFTASSFASTVIPKARSITKVAGTDGQSADEYGLLEKPLTVVVRDQGRRRLTDTVVRFVALDGGIIDYESSDPGGTQEVGTHTQDDNIQEVPTDENGEASVSWSIDPDIGGRRTVRASIKDTNRSVVFTINGTPTSPRREPDDDEDDEDEDDEDEDEAGTITVSPSSLRGETGARVQLSVSPSTTAVTITGATFRSAGGLFVETETGSTRTLLLPNTAGPYTLTLRATGYTPVEVPVTVTAAAAPAPTGPGTLTITEIGARSGNQQAIRVTATPAPSSDLVLTLSGVTNPTRLTIAAGSSSRTVSATLVNASAAQIVTVDATDYTAGSITIPATTPTPTPGDTPTPPADTTGGTPSRISVSGLAAHSGTVNTQLDLPLAVRVLDVNGVGVANARVTFRVRKGQGRLSQRGNGRAIPAVTNSSGRASVPYTPLSVTSTVEAEVKGVTDTVTFTITTGSAPPATSTGAANQYKVGDRLPGTLSGTYNFSGRITINEQTFTCTSSGECVISNGLVTQGTVEVPAPAQPKPVVKTVDYKVGDRIPGNLSGTYSFSNKLTMNGETYTCTSSGECVISNGIVTQGQIQTTTTVSTTQPRRTGTRAPVVNIAAAQRPPMIWVEDGAIYTLVSVDVQRFIPGVTNALNIAIGGGKVYWTEQTGESSGTINSANLDGSGVKELQAIQAVPMGIAVDTAGSKVYWTNSRGRIQSANLDGSGIKNVIQNLASPQDIALAGGNVYWTHSNGGVGFVNLNGQKQVRNISNGADAAGSLVIGGGKVYWTEKTGETGGTVKSANLNGTGATELVSILAAPIGIAVDSSRSKLYWTNARGRIQSAALDGSGVTNVVEGLGSPGDIVLSNSLRTPAGTTTAKTPATAGTSKYDVNGDGRVDNTDASLVSTAMGTSTAKYDVNGDGTVNFLDLLLVFDNRSDGAAGAPMIVGMKLSAVQIDHLQEQIDLLIATGDRSPAAMKTLIYLQQLIALARPEQTQLFANYPNPFNPETWMPYELATDTNVKITIYASNGVVVRTLPLGQQSAGYYTDRERAAYWDGRNALGEQVASGIYFYQLETDEMSSMRKMVILK